MPADPAPSKPSPPVPEATPAAQVPDEPKVDPPAVVAETRSDPTLGRAESETFVPQVESAGQVPVRTDGPPYASAPSSSERPVGADTPAAGTPTDQLPAFAPLSHAFLPIGAELSPSLRNALLGPLALMDRTGLGIVVAPGDPTAALLRRQVGAGAPLSAEGDVNTSADPPSSLNLSGGAPSGASAAASSAPGGASAAVFVTLLLVGFSALCLGKLAPALNRLQREPFIAILERPG